MADPNTASNLTSSKRTRKRSRVKPIGPGKPGFNTGTPRNNAMAPGQRKKALGLQSARTLAPGRVKRGPDQIIQLGPAPRPKRPTPVGSTTTTTVTRRGTPTRPNTGGTPLPPGTSNPRRGTPNNTGVSTPPASTSRNGRPKPMPKPPTRYPNPKRKSNASRRDARPTR